jgi:hypothetical protein|nr:MAG TPA: Kinesin-like protein KIF21A coil, kinesin, motor protein.18A [Caudoviricetes sp.]
MTKLEEKKQELKEEKINLERAQGELLRLLSRDKELEKEIESLKAKRKAKEKEINRLSRECEGISMSISFIESYIEDLEKEEK